MLKRDKEDRKMYDYCSSLKPHTCWVFLHVIWCVSICDMISFLKKSHAPRATCRTSQNKTTKPVVSDTKRRMNLVSWAGYHDSGGHHHSHSGVKVLAVAHFSSPNDTGTLYGVLNISFSVCSSLLFPSSHTFYATTTKRTTTRSVFLCRLFQFPIHLFL